MPSSSLSPIIRTLQTSTVSPDEAIDQWNMYRSVRSQRKDLASRAWRKLLQEGEKRNFVTRLDQSTPETKYGIRALTEKGIIWDEAAPAYLEAQIILVLLAALSKHGSEMALSGPHKVNYHGHLCGTVEDAAGRTPVWDEAQGAYRVVERSEITIAAFLATTLEGQPETMKSSEMEVVGEVERPVVPFQVEVEGYPLRFLERSRYDKLQVPSKGKSEVLRFPVHPESLVIRPGESIQRVWINVRQHNALIQCVCIPLLIVPNEEPGPESPT